ncbi:MAG: hypothetical protein JSU83_12620, partial [Deltaproteobacteria bacterium]
MNLEKPITRRETLQKLAKLSGCLALSGAAAWSLQSPFSALADSGNRKFIIEGVGQTDGYDVKTLTRKTFEAAGGMKQFVSKGDMVVLKPNIS